MRRNVTRATASESSKSRLTLLDLALNSAAIGGLSDARQDGTHSVDQEKTDLCRSKFKSSLDNVVAI